MKRIDIAIAIVCRQQQVLICRRCAGDHLGGYWEFPGGKVEPGETLEQCLARELREELGIEVELLSLLDPIEHDYPDVLVRLHPFLCAHRSGKPRPIACSEPTWVLPTDLRRYRFPPANRALIERVIALLVSPA